MRRRSKLIVALVAGLSAGAWAGPAWAHVTLDPSTAPKGAEITLGFRVPNEEATASTIKVQIFFPSDHPVLGVDPENAPGWTTQIHTAPLNPPVNTDDGPVTSYVSEVDWSGGSIPPGHFQEFYVLAQQLPTTTDQIVFKALQTYSDGNVVRWIQTTPPGGPEPDHPAPVLTLTAPASGSPASSGGDSDGLALAGVVLGALGLLLGAVAVVLVLQRGRRHSNRDSRHADGTSA
jgi:uncharacterized protein YcnI